MIFVWINTTWYSIIIFKGYKMSFYEIVENIDTLNIDEQYELVSILQNKLKDKKREEIMRIGLM